ncbi:GNAT family N-acetyltransferase [Parasphingorhabdus marina]|nr:GNAT family N-acetyltransferase [Parasphingorhabdus marina]
MLDESKNPLLLDNNPYAFWTAHVDGKAKGRIISLVYKKSNARHGTNRAQFGFFDCANDPEIAGTLLNAAEIFARDQGCDELVGNFNLTAMQQAGVMTDGFGARAYTDMIANPRHIPELLTAHGYEAWFPMTTFEVDLDTAVPPRADFDDLTRRGYHFAPVDKSEFQQRFEDARIVLNDGFDENPMFVPLTPEEFQFQAGEMMSILDPRLSSILMHDDRPVGTVICIPDLNGFLTATRSRFRLMTPIHFLRYRLNRRRAVIIFYSVAKDHHGQGLMGAMLNRTIAALRQAKYEQLGITWIADENPASLRQMEKIGARPLQNLHLFRKSIPQ